MLEIFSVQLEGDQQYLNVTKQVERIVRGWGFQNGRVIVEVPHTTCAMLLQEDEPGHIWDLLRRLDLHMSKSERGAPEGSLKFYRHDVPELRGMSEDTDEPANGHAHNKASLLGSSRECTVLDGCMILGKWQQFLFLDFDNSGAWRKRFVHVTGLRGIGDTDAALAETRRELAELRREVAAVQSKLRRMGEQVLAEIKHRQTVPVPR